MSAKWLIMLTPKILLTCSFDVSRMVLPKAMPALLIRIEGCPCDERIVLATSEMAVVEVMSHL
jgi:hypothetical protein